MRVKFKHIDIKNFLSIGEASFDLDHTGYTLISGENNNGDDNALSNGAGKSTLIESIAYALTGETIRGTAKGISNLYTDDGAVVELTFDVDKDSYKIIRSKDNSVYKTNLLIWRNGEEISGKGIRDSEKILSQILPDLTSSLIGSVILLGQGLPLRFTNNTPAGRKEVLEQLSKSDFMIQDLKDRLQRRKNQVSQQQREAEDSILTNNLLIKQVDDTLKKLLAEKQSLMTEGSKDYDAVISEAEVVIKQLDEQIKINQSVEKEKEDLLQQYRDEYCAINDESKAESTKITEQYSAEIQKYKDEKAQHLATISALEKEIKRLESIKDVCPTCGQKLPNVTKPDTSIQRSQMTVERGLLEGVANVLMERETALVGALARSDEHFKEQKDTATRKAQAVKAEIASLETKIDALKEKLLAQQSDLAKAKVTKENYLKRCETVNVDIEEATKKQEALKQESTKLNGTLNIVKERADILSKFNTLLTRDFRGYLLKNVIDYIGERARVYSKGVFGTDNLMFTLNGNAIDIGYNGKHYENLSGGERQKVDIIIQFAIRDMLCKFLNFSSNILAVDEVFDNLDADGCNSVMNLISSKLSDVEGVYIISHHSSELQIPVDREIRVTKNEKGVSSISVI